MQECRRFPYIWAVRELLSALVILLSVLCSCSKKDNAEHISNKGSTHHILVRKDCELKTCFVDIEGESLSIQINQFEFSNVHSYDYTDEGRAYKKWELGAGWFRLRYWEHNHLLDLFFEPNNTGEDRKVIITAWHSGRRKTIYVTQTAY